MSDCISRRSAISICDNAIDLWNGQLGTGALIAVRDEIKALPSAQPTLYGYDLRSLIIFADAVKKNGVAESEMNDFAKNAEAAWKYAWEEFVRMQKEALESVLRGDHSEGGQIS